MKGIVDGADVPGGDWPGIAHLATVTDKRNKQTKAQTKQIAQDKAKHQADLDMATSHPGERKAASNDIASRSLSFNAKQMVGGGSSKVAPS